MGIDPKSLDEEVGMENENQEFWDYFAAQRSDPREGSAPIPTDPIIPDEISLDPDFIIKKEQNNEKKPPEKTPSLGSVAHQAEQPELDGVLAEMGLSLSDIAGDLPEVDEADPDDIDIDALDAPTDLPTPPRQEYPRFLMGEHSIGDDEVYSEYFDGRILSNEYLKPNENNSELLITPILPLASKNLDSFSKQNPKSLHILPQSAEYQLEREPQPLHILPQSEHLFSETLDKNKGTLPTVLPIAEERIVLDSLKKYLHRGKHE